MGRKILRRKSRLQNYMIFMDASADLDPRYAHEHDIQCVPMTCVSGGVSFSLTGFEGPDVLRSFYSDMRKGKMISTSQISPDEYVTAFRPYLEEGRDIIYLSLSSGLTNTYHSALQAKEKLERKCPQGRLFPIDTLSATGGINLLVEKAVSMRSSGVPVDIAAQELEVLARRVCHVFIVDDLMHLMRGGRVSATSAVFGTALHIKPVLVIDPEGRLTVVEKKRGIKAALRELQVRFEKARDAGEHRVYMCHSDSDDFVSSLIPMVREIDPEADISPNLLSPVIGAHTGSGMISVIFIGNRNAILS